MSKISQYLNEHLLGEVTTSAPVRKQLSTDGSMLSLTPDIVAYPKVTNDIRKVLRFTHQLAGKGHAISVTTRGAGTDQTGAAVGQGIIVNTTAHMNEIFEYDAKQRLIRVQPGLNFGALQAALKLQGCFIPAFPDSVLYSTIGGAVANNSSGRYSGQRGAIDESVAELEVVLANGDVIQTKRISKKELGKKKGLQTFEGEIYRAVDNLIEDSRELIEAKLETGIIDNTGYANIAKVKQKNGSFDLTPLFVGSQGTLGVISEMILKAEFYNSEEILVALIVKGSDNYIDILDELRKLTPESIEIFDGSLLKLAHAHGKRYPGVMNDDAAVESASGLILCSLQDFNDRARKRKLKKIQKLAEKFESTIISAEKPEQVRELAALRGIPYAALYAEESKNVVPPLFRGVYIPADRYEEFIVAVTKLESAIKIALPCTGYAVDGVYSFWPQLPLHTATDKQKLLKLYDAFASLVVAHGGSVVAEAGEGRMKSPFIAKSRDSELEKLYTEIRKIFDQYSTLNTGVKQAAELRTVVSHLRPGYDGVDFPGFTGTGL